MNKRITAVREMAGMSQEAFANKINLSRNFVWMIENEKRIPSDRTISDICDKFGVNETWLRTGEGEMLTPRDEHDQLMELFGRVLAGKDELREGFISVIEQTPDDDLVTIAEFFVKFAEAYKNSRS